MFKRLTVTLFVIWQCTSALQAEVVDWLYQSTHPVSSQRTSEVNRASRLGMITVLQRVTGAKRLEQTSALRQTLNNASNFVLQHSFTVQQDVSSSTVTQWITIDYDAEAVQGLVRQLGLPIWPSNRPTILLSLSHWRDGAFEFLNGIDQPQDLLVRVLENAAVLRGLELKWSQNEEPDYGIYNFVDHMTIRNRTFAAGSINLGLDVVLGLELKPFRNHFLLTSIIPTGFPTGKERSEIVDNDLAGVEAAFHWVADELFELYGVSTVDNTQIDILVEDILTLKDYLAVLQYLNDWEFVDRVDLTLVTGTSFHFAVHASTSVGQFLVHVLADDRFELQDTNETQEAMVTLIYRGS